MCKTCLVHTFRCPPWSRRRCSCETSAASGEGDDIARIETDRFGGNGTLLLRVNLSCPYRGEVFAFVNGTSASSAIEVAATETIEPEPREVEAPTGEGRS